MNPEWIKIRNLARTGFAGSPMGFFDGPVLYKQITESRSLKKIIGNPQRLLLWAFDLEYRLTTAMDASLQVRNWNRKWGEHYGYKLESHMAAIPAQQKITEFWLNPQPLKWFEVKRPKKIGWMFDPAKGDSDGPVITATPPQATAFSV